MDSIMNLYNPTPQAPMQPQASTGGFQPNLGSFGMGSQPQPQQQQQNIA